MNNCKVCRKPIPSEAVLCSWCEANVTLEENVESVVQELTKSELTRELYKLQLHQKGLEQLLQSNQERIRDLELLIGDKEA